MNRYAAKSRLFLFCNSYYYEYTKPTSIFNKWVCITISSSLCNKTSLSIVYQHYRRCTVPSVYSVLHQSGNLAAPSCFALVSHESLAPETIQMTSHVLPPCMITWIVGFIHFHTGQSWRLFLVSWNVLRISCFILLYVQSGLITSILTSCGSDASTTGIICVVSVPYKLFFAKHRWLYQQYASEHCTNHYAIVEMAGRVA